VSLQVVVDAVAKKVAGISGMKASYGPGASDPTVPFIPEDIGDTPVAVTTYEGFEIVIPSQFEDVHYSLLTTVYVRNDDAGASYKALIPFIELFIVAFRTGKSLGIAGGVTVEAEVKGGDRFTQVTVNDVEYLTLPVHLEVREVRTVTVSV
jgi:hypothetical protein